MKLINLFFYALPITLFGCATSLQQQAQSVEPFIRPSVAAITSAVLITQIPQQRHTLAADIYAASTLVYALDTGKAPSPEQLRLAIASVPSGGDADQIAAIAASVISVYAGVYDSIQNKPELAIKIIADIAAGLQDAASSVIPKPLPLLVK